MIHVNPRNDAWLKAWGLSEDDSAESNKKQGSGLIVNRNDSASGRRRANSIFDPIVASQAHKLPKGGGIFKMLEEDKNCVEATRRNLSSLRDRSP